MNMDLVKGINWFGVAGGVLMLILPFSGPWWQAHAGDGMMDLSFSPFDLHLSILDQSMESPLVNYALLAAKLTVLVGGLLLVLGSIFTGRWWSKHLMKFGATKVFWMVVGMVLLLVMGAFLANRFLPTLVSSIVKEGNIDIDVEIPYLSGESSGITVQAGSTAVNVPITTFLTSRFWIATVVGFLGIAARVYHRKFTHQSMG